MNHILRVVHLFLWVCLLISVILMTSNLPSSAQEDPEEQSEVLEIEPTLRFRHLTSDDGLVQNTITGIAQDQHGFMWFGTAAGLSRYDGYEFRNYVQNPAVPNGLTLNGIRDIYIDRQGDLWIGMEGGGVDQFDPARETFTNYRGHIEENTVNEDRVFSTLQDSAGNFWFGGTPFFGISRRDPQGDFTLYHSDRPDARPYPGTHIYQMAEDNLGQIWVAGNTVLTRYDVEKDAFVAVELPDVEGEPVIRSVLMGQDGYLWVGGSEALYRLDPKDYSVILYDVARGINKIVQDHEGFLWLGTTNGLHQFDPVTEQRIQTFRNDPLRSDSLSNNGISELFVDAEGILWIGTESDLNIDTCIVHCG